MRISVGSVNHMYDVTIMKKYSDSFADISCQEFVDGHLYHIRFEVRMTLKLSNGKHIICVTHQHEMSRMSPNLISRND